MTALLPLWLIKFFTTGYGRYVALAGVAFLAFIRLRSEYRKQGREDLLDEQEEDYTNRTEEARETFAETERETQDETPDEQLAAIRRDW